MFEIRWHGRGGQGAKTAALLFGEACMSTGKFFQAFPEYGPERMGAPVLAFDRLSDEPITIHSGVETPDVVVVLDVTLLETQNVKEGLKEDGKILINTKESPSFMKKKLKLNDGKVYTVDASGIAKETLGKEIPNTPMLGALAKVSGLISLEDLINDSKKRIEKKFRGMPEIIEGNINSIKRAYEEVKG